MKKVKQDSVTSAISEEALIEKLKTASTFEDWAELVTCDNQHIRGTALDNLAASVAVFEQWETLSIYFEKEPRLISLVERKMTDLAKTPTEKGTLHSLFPNKEDPQPARSSLSLKSIGLLTLPVSA